MQNSINNFLNTFQDSALTLSLLYDRIDDSTLKSLNSYARIISKTRCELQITDEDLISSSMILGFLLKTHIDREKLNKVFKNF